MLKYRLPVKSNVIQVTIDPGLAFAIIGAIIVGATYIAVLEYRFRQLEKNPLLSAVKEIQKGQLIDLVNKLLNEKESEK